MSHYTEADFIDSDSEHYVKKRIFMFSLIVSSVMFGSLILTFLITGFIYFRQSPVKSPPPYQMDNSHLHQPLLLHRAPRLGLSRLQKPCGIHDITIIKYIS